MRKVIVEKFIKKKIAKKDIVEHIKPKKVEK